MTKKVTIKDVTYGLANKILSSFNNSIPETEVWDIAIKVLYGLVNSGLDLSTLKSLSNVYYNPEVFKSLLIAKLGNSVSITSNTPVTSQVSTSQTSEEVPEFIKDNPWVNIIANKVR